MSIPAVSPEMLRSHRYRGFDRLFDDDEQRFIFFSIHLAPRSGRFLRLQEYFGNYGRNFQNILKRSLRALRLPCPTLYCMDIRDAMNRANIRAGEILPKRTGEECPSKRTPGSSSQDDDHCYLCLGTDVQSSNGRNEILFLFVYEPEEFTIHAIFIFIGERPLNFPETEGPRNGPARSPSVRSPVDTVHAGFRSGRADPKLLGPLPSGTPPAFPELPAVDLGHGFSTPPL